MLETAPELAEMAPELLLCHTGPRERNTVLPEYAIISKRLTMAKYRLQHLHFK